MLELLPEIVDERARAAFERLRARQARRVGRWRRRALRLELVLPIRRQLQTLVTAA